MSTHKQILGKFGENAAVEFLQKSGYTILDRNFRTQYGEIDIVAAEDNYIVFVEVKARKKLTFGEPQLSVNLSKQKKLVMLAMQYIKLKKLQTKNVRFDVVAINQDNIELIKNAFVPTSKYLY